VAQEIFIDASFWTALFYARDERHTDARNVWPEIHSSQWLMLTTNWTLYETLTFLSSRRRHDIAVQALDFITRSAQLVRIEIAGLENRSLEIFRRHSDKRWSVVDCANFACIEQRRCEQALSYDGNFRQAQGEFNFQMFAA
jgi:uncharacterized protein